MEGRRPSMRVISIQAKNRAIAEIRIERNACYKTKRTCDHFLPTRAVPHGHPDQIGSGAPQRDRFNDVLFGKVPSTIDSNLSKARAYLTPSDKACPISRKRTIPVKMEVTTYKANPPPNCSSLILADEPSVRWCLSIVVQTASPVKEMR